MVATGVYANRSSGNKINRKLKNKNVPFHGAGDGNMAEAITEKLSAAVPMEAQVGSVPYMKGGEPLFINMESDVGVLQLHGFTSTPHQFRECSQYFVKRGYTVYTPLIAGHGTSPRELAKTTANDWMRSTNEALQFLRRYVKHVFVIGNSFGGNLAFWLAHKYPGALTGVVSLGTPIVLRWQRIIYFRVYTYGWLKEYYRKLGRDYKVDYIDLSDEVSYPVIPVSSLREFLRFIRATVPALKTVRVPTLMIQADRDPVVHPKSVQIIHEHLGSDYKKVYWLNGRYHTLPDIDRREEVFHKVDKFIEELMTNL